MPFLLLMVLLSASSVVLGSVPFQDDLGAALNQPNSSRITLRCEEIYKIGRSGKSFAIKEFCEPQPSRPRLAVISTRPLPVSPYWTCDVTGVLSSFSRVTGDGITINQRVLIVSPENVLIYCDQRGRPFLFPPLKGLGIEWPNKRSLAEIVGESLACSASISTMDESSLPPMPDSLDSETAPVYCATIADAKAQYSSTSRNLVELQCRPFSNATSTQFTLGQDNPADSITVYFTGSSTLSGRINRIVGTIQKDASNNYWIEVDSGTNWTEGDFVGSVQSISSGTIAWAKTFADSATLPSTLSGKVVTRTFPSLGYFYIEETNRSSGIRVSDFSMASSVAIGDIVDVDGDLSTDDGERVIIASSTTITDWTTISPIGPSNRALAGGSFNVLTPGAYNASGLNNVGLLARAWGKVTSVGTDYFYFDDGSNCDDGSGSSGVRVVGVSGYMPSVNDYVAVTGISGLATYATNLARTVRLANSSDISGICPTLPPTSLTVSSTGSGKLTLYWNGVSGATGYNIYRGTTSGGENYATPVNGGTPVNTPSYSGSNIYTFTDTGLTNGTEYFYTVKAVAGCGESQVSNESGDIPASDGIPWDSGDPAQILPAFRAAFSGVSMPSGTLRVCGPDGRIYQDGYSTWQSPDGVVNPETGEVTLAVDGSVTQLPGDGQVYGSGMQMLVTLPNAKTGPYRKVRTRSGYSYRGVKGRITLPDSSLIRVTPYTYPGTTVNTKDVPYVYYGGTSGGNELDAGIYWHPGTSKWRLFMNINGQWVNMPPDGVFDSGQDVTMHFSVSSTKNNTVQVTVNDGVRSRTLGSVVKGFPSSASGVRVKRCHSIAQSLRGADKTRGYRSTGSEFLDTEWHDGVVQNTNGTFSRWGTTQTTANDEGSFPAKGSIVNWTVVNPLSQYKYEAEIGINIDL